jgi:general secretion pathway protein H
MIKIRLKDSRAFTLIEMLVVVFIISLIAAVVLPSFSGFGSKDVTDDARLMASVIRYLNDTSRNTGEAKYMILDLDKKTVSYPDDKGTVIKNIGSLYSAKLTSASEMHSGSIRVDFQPSGLSAQLLVRLSGDSQLLDVLYNPYSGRVMIEREADGIRKNGGNS